MTDFKSLGLSEVLLKAIESMGFVTPTAIQEQAIPALLEGDNDLVGLAQTGTGKTAAFGLPMLQLIDPAERFPQGLVLCPTRELCLQITGDLKAFSQFLGEVNIVAVYGGANISNQIRDLRRGAQIIVATPGRMLDIINRGATNLSNIRYLVLDEADEMLNMGFQEDINSILSNTPDTKNTWLFSATMPNEVKRISRSYMDDPVEITVGSKNTGNVNIEHEYYVVRAREKYAALKRIVDYNPEIFAIIFTRTKIEAQEIAEHLIRDGYNADALHGDLSQQQRDKVMKRYRDRSLQLLIATDVAARGIDVSDITHVINYSLPDDIENYTHRSGRTARAGKSGVSIAIINSRETGRIRQIEKVIGKKFEKGEIPSGYDVCEKQLFALIHKVHEVKVNEEQIGPYLNRIYKEFENLDKEELIRRFASLEFNRFLEYYLNAPDLNSADERPSKSRERDHTSGGGSFTRMFVNLGSVDDLTRGDLLRFICDNSGISGQQVGRIDLKGIHTFFEVESSEAETVYNGLKSGSFKGRNIRVDYAEGNKSGGGRPSKSSRHGAKPSWKSSSRGSQGGKGKRR
ncbi:ATP-dependent RNA helicase DeaD [Anseongella ginsenosidimutans]|uniref:RNA helicase n=1 Tax=Anseongella ginsenosidimutans TaxID=496056 RepID=A0A4R3KPJ9_9SPHI|nr:DEAD/DEAH box helicase [Anseongella ginsenosidimutans]QEC53973.1 DEAD/DEAH box helicase [Anseongella ginsenosidimutans]TCS86359.1 ATP-dependent RNA helicase DeaD [Anseongella ginsenosidimutans]